MDIELEKLAKIGIQKIYVDTHIPAKHIKALLDANFNSFPRVQFLGFISILQREYDDNFVSIKRKGLEFFDELEEQSVDDGLLVAPKQIKKKTSPYLFVILVLLIAGLLYTSGLFEEKTPSTHKIDNTKIDEIHKNITLDKKATTLELNTTKTDDNITIEKIVEKSFKIVAKSKAWIGYINLETRKQYQKTFVNTFELDPKEDWLIIFGHPYVDMSVNGVLIDFGERKNIRFVYENNSLITIDSEKFKELSKGSGW